MVTEETTVAAPADAKPRWYTQTRVKTLAGYLSALALCLLVLSQVYDLGSHRRNMPYFYHSDTMFYHIVVKSVIDNGWFLTNPLMGAPGQLDLRDVPTSDNNFHFLLIKLLAGKTSYYVAVLNYFYLLSFPLTLLCTLFVLRQLKLSWLVAVAASLLYTFWPYHFTRGQHHLFLSAYWQIPLMVLVLLWLCRGELVEVEAAPRWPRIKWRSPKLPLSLLVCLLIGSSGYYYAFFACFFLLMVAAVVALQQRSVRGLLLPALFIVLIGATAVLNLLPSILHVTREGSVPVVSRLAVEADMYGLRIAQILLPVRWHRWQWLEDLKTQYNRRLLINENDDAAMGFIGVCGFLGLLWWFFAQRPAVAQMNESGARGLYHYLSLLTMLGLLLATMGGFGSLIAFLGLPQVRAYNRISIFLSFFALLAVALWLNQLAERWATTRARQAVFGLMLAGLVTLGLLDQIAPRFLPNYQNAEDEYMSDELFVKEIEKQVPHGAMILQLPMMSFPENPRVHRMLDYDLARGYLHSNHLRWSYGTIKGREWDFWLRRMPARPTPELIEHAAWAGFSGIYIDHYGYQDEGAKLEGELKSLLGLSPIVSPNGRQTFFNLEPYRQQLRAQTPQAEWAAREEAALHPIMAIWQTGFSDYEGTPEDNWRWCDARGRMQFINRTAQPKEMKLEVSFFADNDGTLKLNGFLNETLRVNRFGVPYSKTVLIPPGAHTVHFACDARRVLPPNDFRDLVFRVRNFKMTPAQVVPEPAAQPSPTPAEKAKGAGAGR
jgi:phosphoglycerol transferase